MCIHTVYGQQDVSRRGMHICARIYARVYNACACVCAKMYMYIPAR